MQNEFLQCSKVIISKWHTAILSQLLEDFVPGFDLGIFERKNKALFVTLRDKNIFVFWQLTWWTFFVFLKNFIQYFVYILMFSFKSMNSQFLYFFPDYALFCKQ